MTEIPTAPARLALIGAGSRGQDVYGRYCLAHPELGQVVAVADTDADRAAAVAAEHGVPAAATFTSWADLLATMSDLDAVIVATPDRHHVDPVIAAVRRGVRVLVEKPLAPTAAELDRLRDGVGTDGRLVTVAHVLRHASFFVRLKQLLDAGAIGTLTTIEHAEHIGYWHFAHSYVRGNWRREDRSSPMILAKACHDLDLIRWFAGAPWTSVSSVGALSHFHGGHRPHGAPAHCIEGCPVAPTCPFDATRMYDPDHPVAGPVAAGIATRGWPSWDEAMRGPYGRCVYQCDNDVADHQLAQIEFANGVLATLTVAAFTATNTRHVRLLGTHGDMSGDLSTGTVTLRGFRPGEQERHMSVGDGSARPANGRSHGSDEAFRGHGGGDAGLMRAFLTAAPEAAARTGFDEAVDGHLLAFAAEESRLAGRTVDPAGQPLPSSPP